MADKLHDCWTEWAVSEEEKAQPRSVRRRENMAATVPPASQVKQGTGPLEPHLGRTGFLSHPVFLKQTIPGVL